VLAESSREVRFTRAGQAVPFFVSGGLLNILSLCLLSGSLLPRPWGSPELRESYWVLLVTVPISLILLRFAWKWIRQAYIVFSPFGIEIFPAFKVETQANLITWGEIHHIEMNSKLLCIHFNEQETKGTIVTLAPVLKSKIRYLEKLLSEYPALKVTKAKCPKLPN
jgi:hypothetical protein